MTKHAPTPGPWIVDGEDEFPLGIPVIGIATAVCPDPNWKMIAYVQPNADNFKLGEEDHANARVLAAAPIMLAALHKAREEIEAHWTDVELAADHGGMDVALKQIRAAIAEAEGRS